jgi:hypothetical protein
LNRAAHVDRLILATLCAIVLLVLAPRGAAPGNGTWLGFAAGPPVVAAASPEPSAPGGDTRSVGEGPGLVGAPFLAIVGVVALGVATAGATLLYLRLSGAPATGRGGTGAPTGPGEARPKRRG